MPPGGVAVNLVQRALARSGLRVLTCGGGATPLPKGPQARNVQALVLPLRNPKAIFKYIGAHAWRRVL